MKLMVNQGKNEDDASLAKWERSPLPLRDVMDRLFEESFWNPWGLMPASLRSFNLPQGGWLPKIDISETDQEIRIKVDVPNVDPSQMDVSVEGNILTISGNKEEKREEKGETWHRIEREVGSFQRSVELPSGAQTDQIEATSNNGTILITIPRTAEMEKKKIAVKVKPEENGAG